LLALKSVAVSLTGTESKIVQVTIDLLGELRYKGMTTRQIAESAGVDEVTLFRKFGSKETLAKRAVGLAQNQVRMDLESACGKKTGDPRTDLMNLGLSLMEVLDRHREAVVAIMFEAKREPYFAAAITGMVQFILNLVRKYLKNYGLRETQMSKADLDALTLSLASYAFFKIIVRESLLDKKSTSENRKREFRVYVEFLLKNVSSGTKGSD
jgi:TetR/AcrR family transcriptional regulator